MTLLGVSAAQGQGSFRQGGTAADAEHPAVRLAGVEEAVAFVEFDRLDPDGRRRPAEGRGVDAKVRVLCRDPGADALEALPVGEQQHAADAIGTQGRGGLTQGRVRPGVAAVESGGAGRGGAGVGHFELP